MLHLSSKILNTFLFLFSNNMLVILAGINKMLVRMANREDPDQTACLSRTFKQVTSVQNFRTFTVSILPLCQLW